jgi:hypothetical protein
MPDWMDDLENSAAEEAKQKTLEEPQKAQEETMLRHASIHIFEALRRSSNTTVPVAGSCRPV